MEERWVHILFIKNNQACCPKCGGLAATVKSDEIIMHCIDCGTFYRAIDFGKAESELECEEVRVG